MSQRSPRVIRWARVVVSRGKALTSLCAVVILVVACNLRQSGGFSPPAPPPTGELRSPLPPLATATATATPTPTPTATATAEETSAPAFGSEEAEQILF